MDNGKVSIVFQPSGRMISAKPGTPLRDVAAEAGIGLDYPCGGQGSCGKCRVRLVGKASGGHDGSAPTLPTETEEILLTEKELLHGMRLACQTDIKSSMTVEVPEQSLLGHSYQILTGEDDVGVLEADPPVQKIDLKLTKPTLEDDAPDIDRIRRELGPVQVSLDVMRTIPSRLRTHNFQGTAVVADEYLIDLEPPDTPKTCPVAAFDIGTTTLVGRLFDLTTGLAMASAARMNPQTSYGDDVLSRILFASRDDASLNKIHLDVSQAVNAMLSEMATEVGLTPQDIYEISFAGNTTMQHLLCKLNPAALGQTPFVPNSSEGFQVPARELDIQIHPQGRAFVFPVIGGFVGGDTVACILTTEIDTAEKPTMFVDIGTNGEIVVVAKGKKIATSCAAGPAFEGALITHGMRAAAGAIERIILDDDVHYKVIGNTSPVGICGSALIDIVAELLRKGIVLSQGFMLGPDDVPETTDERLRERLIDTDRGPGFIIAHKHETETGHDIVLFQKDIRELQLASGAIRAGITIMLKRAEIDVDGLDALLVGGGFGNYVRCENAQQIGLLPYRLHPEKFQFLGNTSLKGARLAALSKKMRHKSIDLAHRIEHIDLSLDMEFQEIFVEAMFFPEVEA